MGADERYAKEREGLLLVRIQADWDKLRSAKEKEDFLRKTTANHSLLLKSDAGKLKFVYPYLNALALIAYQNTHPQAVSHLIGWIENPPCPGIEDIQSTALWLLARTGHFGKYQRIVEHLCDSRQGWKVIDLTFIQKQPAKWIAKDLDLPSLLFLDLDPSAIEQWIEFYKIYKDPQPWEKGLEKEAAKARAIFGWYFQNLDDKYHGGWDQNLT